MAKKHYALYGNIRIKRLFCRRCQGYSFVIDGKLQCCKTSVDEDGGHKSYKICDSSERRKKPTSMEKQKIKEVQNDRCLYCGISYGVPYWYNRKLRFTKIHYDHLVPYSYTHSNKKCFVGSCNICNSIKSNLIFETVEEVYRYVQYNRKKKGYQFIENDEQSTQMHGVQQFDTEPQKE